jgi:hypothetical protein
MSEEQIAVVRGFITAGDEQEIDAEDGRPAA